MSPNAPEHVRVVDSSGMIIFECDLADLLTESWTLTDLGNVLRPRLGSRGHTPSDPIVYFPQWALTGIVCLKNG
jgi:hypothetical protein